LSERYDYPESNNEPRILLHAPSAAALTRARGNATNLAKDAQLVLVRIVVNGAAVSAALDEPDASADAIPLVCPKTLQKIGRQALSLLTVLASGAILEIATLQRDGWRYVRA